MDLYHITEWEKTEPLVYEPRVPTNRCDNEDTIIPRVCVALSVTDCIAAVNGIGGKVHQHDPNEDRPFDVDDKVEWCLVQSVYKVKGEVVPFAPSKALLPDVEKTGEMWLLTPTNFEWVGHIVSRNSDRDHMLYEWIWVKDIPGGKSSLTFTLLSASV